MTLQTSDKLFSNQWETYQWLIDFNIIAHKEFISIASKLLAKVFKNRPIVLTDMGCGNSMLIPELTAGLVISKYYGIDVAENALTASHHFLSKHHINCQYIKQCLFKGIPSSFQAPDLIYSAFAMHHGKSSTKKALFEKLSHQTNKGTLFLLVDGVHSVGQSHNDYCQMIEQHLIDFRCREDWLADFARHMREFDYPETDNGLVSLAQEAGWTVCHRQKFSPYKNFTAVLMLLENS